MTHPDIAAIARGREDAPVQNLVQFAQARGLKTDFDLRSHIHAGLRSAPTSKTYQRWYERTARELADAAVETERLYLEAIAAGEVRAPSKPTLEEIAAGCPDNQATQAAHRLLEKRAARAAAGDHLLSGKQAS